MRAAVLTQIRAPLEIRALPDPVPEPGGVVLEVLAAGVCRSDWHVWSGGDPVPMPHVPGHEYCGTVVATGAGVARWSVGDRVIAPFILACGRCPACARGAQTTCADQALPGFTRPGAFASHVAVPFADHNLTALPDWVAPDCAAALGCRVTTAWQALTGRADLRPGEWLAVFGAGGVGLAALMLARAMGARVAVVDVVPEKLAYAQAQGAELSVDARGGDAAEQIRAATGGGAHVALEALGITETTAGAIRCLRPLGRMVQVGMPAGRETTMALPWDAVYSGQLAIFGTRGMAGWRYPSLLSFLEASRLDLAPLIARHVPLSAVSGELAAFDGPMPPGVAVVTDFTA